MRRIRLPYRQGKEATANSIEAIERLFRTVAPADEVAAIVVEPVQGEGGYMVPPQNFFDELQRLARAHGILLIFDEVQCGMGRTGKMWACGALRRRARHPHDRQRHRERHAAERDVARAELMNWPPGAHASTFGGNPVSAAAALVTIDLLENGLIENAARIGAHIMDRLKDWPSRFAHVGEVRGLGLMIGIELVRDRETKERAPELRDEVIQRAFERGLLILGRRRE